LKKTKALRLSTRILILLAIIILGVSLYNLFTFLSSAISSETFGLNLSKNESTGDWLLSFSANPRNNGFLDVSLFLEITVLDPNDRIVATDSKYVYIKAGGSQSFSITLTIPAEFFPGGDLQNAKGYFQMKMSIRTLGDLIGLTQIMKIGSGGT